MLEIISKGFQSAKNLLKGQTVITEENIQEAVKEIRISLLEADVEIQVVRNFIDRVKTRTLGEIVQTTLKASAKKLKTAPHEHFIYICHQELLKLLGDEVTSPLIYRHPLTIVMLIGLQGSGKTTTCGKLANYLKSQKRKPLLVAADIYRPAAVQQLEILADKLQVPFFSEAGATPVEICERSLLYAKTQKCDVVIFDTAGRLTIDQELMQELADIKERTKPDNILLICDAMAGQDTVHTAKEFNQLLNISGFILTKLDGDARGGAALAIKEVTGKTIKFIGVGEGLDKLEPFAAEGLASRILGMGDVVSLMRDFEAAVDEKEAAKQAKKMLKGNFTLTDFLEQLKMLKKMGSLKDIYEKMPLFGDAQNLPAGVNLDDKSLQSIEALIHSMTLAERQDPEIINASRIARIAKGAGQKSEQVTELLQRFKMMKQMMSNLGSGGGMLNLLGSLPGLKNLAGLGKLGKLANLPKALGELGGLGNHLGKLTHNVGESLTAMAQGKELAPLPANANGLLNKENMAGLAELAGLAGNSGEDAGTGELLQNLFGSNLPAGLSGYGGYPGMGGNRKILDPKEKEKLKHKKRLEKLARKRSRAR